jgi:hypothetical protein
VALLLACSCGAGGAGPEPQDAAGLVRDGTRPAIVRRGDLDGDGVVELVVASVSEKPSTFSLPTPFLEVFAHSGDAWRRVFDATGHAPEGAEAPGPMLEAADEGFAVGQTVELLELADLEHDGSSEIVTAVSNVGATAGPLALWVVSMDRDDVLHTEYYSRTERGGKVALRGDRVAIEFGVYKRNDPGCCPSSFEIDTIGYDPDRGVIRVLERERHRVETP